MKGPARSLVEIVAWGCALLGAIQLPGGLLDSVIHGEIRSGLILAIALLGGAVLFLRRLPDRGWPRRERRRAAGDLCSLPR